VKSEKWILRVKVVFTFWFEEFHVTGVSANAHPLPPKGDLPYVFTFFVKV
jgi:hypothetical protein